MRKGALIVLSLFAAMGFSAPAFALFYGPSITVPTAISPGSTINIDLATVASSTFVAPPAGSNPPCNAGVCNYPLQSCTNPAAFYVAIHKVGVTDPNGNQYSLGSASGIGVYWPANQGGGMSNNKPPAGIANELNITVTQSDVLTFGAGGTGPTGTSFASEDFHTSAPFTATSDTAGPYYWWTVKGNVYGPNLRLDKNPLLNPTLIHGTYTVDVEGVAVCGTTTTAIHHIVFFDAAIVFVTPEFGSSAMLVAGAALGLLMLARRGSFGRKLSPV